MLGGYQLNLLWKTWQIKMGIFCNFGKNTVFSFDFSVGGGVLYIVDFDLSTKKGVF
jgi:hypothetical protein